MSGNSTLVATGGAAAAALAGGPLAEVFNELALVLALMGAAGGMSRGLAIALPWREVARGVVLGALLATGLGVLLPHLLGPWIGQSGAVTVPALAACAFLAGFLQDILVARLRNGGAK
jgi:hypothetical protein